MCVCPPVPGPSSYHPPLCPAGSRPFSAPPPPPPGMLLGRRVSARSRLAERGKDSSSPYEKPRGYYFSSGFFLVSFFFFFGGGRGHGTTRHDMTRHAFSLLLPWENLVRKARNGSVCPGQVPGRGDGQGMGRQPLCSPFPCSAGGAEGSPQLSVLSGTSPGARNT